MKDDYTSYSTNIEDNRMAFKEGMTYILPSPPPTVNYYTSDYGDFQIPDDIFNQTKFESGQYESIAPDINGKHKGWDVVPVDRCQTNAPFFAWLSECEKEARA